MCHIGIYKRSRFWWKFLVVEMWPERHSCFFVEVVLFQYMEHRTLVILYYIELVFTSSDVHVLRYNETDLLKSAICIRAYRKIGVELFITQFCLGY